jgi:hypothetical protein
MQSQLTATWQSFLTPSGPLYLEGADLPVSCAHQYHTLNAYCSVTACSGNRINNVAYVVVGGADVISKTRRICYTCCDLRDVV